MVSTERPRARDVRDYVRIVRHRRWVIASVTAVLVLLALLLSLAQTPMYKATADILLKARVSETLFDQSNQSKGQSSDPVATEIQLLRSKAVRDAVRTKLGSHAAPAIAAKRIGQTDVVRIISERTNAKDAAAIANEYANQFIEFRRRQAVADLLAAGTQIEVKIAELQHQINAEADQTKRDSLLAQQSGFKQQFDQLQVDAALKTGGAQLVDPADVPVSPFKPTPLRTTIYAGVIGLILGLGLAFLREYLDDKVRSKDEVERASEGLPVIAMIPFVRSWKDKETPSVVSLTSPASAPAEAYRTLRTAIQFMGVDRSMKTVQVTSAAASEGKTTTLANLAVAFARSGMRVLVLDCDIRRPRVHQFFGLSNNIGFTSLLLGRAKPAEAVQAVPGEPMIRVLASGPIPPNPSELLGGVRTGEILHALHSACDIVLIDSPPVLPVTDAAVLARRVDATFMVVAAGTTTRREMHGALATLRQVNAPLLGIILNGVGNDDGYGYGYGYGRGYGYTQEPANGSKRKGRTETQEPAAASSPAR